MAKLSIGAAILISIILGVILLSILGIGGIFTLVITGFVATYLTAPEKRSYKAGGIAGAILGVLIFIHGLFISPTLPIDPPSISSFTWISLELSGIFTLILGFIVLILICYLFGSIGGLIAQKVFKNEAKQARAHIRRRGEKTYKKTHRRSLKRNYR